jgi:hypothetical protein
MIIDAEKAAVHGQVLLFPCGMLACFVAGEQVPELQAPSPIVLWAQYIEALGYDPLKFRFETFTHQHFGFVRRDDGSLTIGEVRPA